MTFITRFVEEHKTDYELLELESVIILVALDRAYEMGWKPALVRAVINFALESIAVTRDNVSIAIAKARCMLKYMHQIVIDWAEMHHEE